MAERLVTLAELQGELEALLKRVEEGETLVLVDDQPGAPRRRRVALVRAAVYDQAIGRPAHDVEAKVGGVAGGLVAGAGATLGSVTGRPEMTKGARKLGRRVGRALAAGVEALHTPKDQEPHP